MNKPITISLLILMSWSAFLPSAFCLAPESTIEEKAFPDLLLKRINPQVPEGMVYVPAEIIPSRTNEYTGEEVSIINDALLREEINAGRILYHQGQFFILMRDPSVDFGSFSEGNRSWTVGLTTIKGGGLNSPETLKGLKVAFKSGDYFWSTRILNGSLSSAESGCAEAWYLRELYHRYEFHPAMVLAKKYGVKIDMLIEPIAVFRPKAFPMMKLETEAQRLINEHKVQLPEKVTELIPPNIVLIEANNFLEFIGVNETKRKEYDPIVYYYRGLQNRLRNPRIQLEQDLETKRPFYEYYGYTLRDGKLWKEEKEYPIEEVHKEILLGAAARYGVFIYLVHTGLERLTWYPGGSIFNNSRMNDPYHGNVNPLCIFDYDTFGRIYKPNSKELYPGLWRSVEEAYASDEWNAYAELGRVWEAFPVSENVQKQAIELLKAIARGKGEIIDNKSSPHLIDSAL